MIIAAIVAGGAGRRMGSTVPKQFLKLGEKSILNWSVEAFLKHEMVEKIIVAVPKEWINYTKQLLDERNYGERRKRILVTEGGANRNETLWRITETAVNRLKAPKDTILITHDAVRPFVSEAVITACLQALMYSDEATAVTAAVPAQDTILHIGDDGSVKEVPKRSKMLLAQTPQSVYLGRFRELYARMTPAERELRTDISGIYIGAGLRVRTVPGDYANRKITTPEDYEAAQVQAAKPELQPDE